MAYAKRTDANQTEIVEEFRSYGFSVYITSHVGKGFPDIIIGYGGVNYLIEIKDGKKAKSAQKLTKAEQEFFDTWRGQVIVINSREKAYNLAMAIITKHKKPTKPTLRIVE